jgi:hypothetical protein
MQATTFWRAVTMDRTDMLGDVLAFLASHDVRFCAIGGVAVNAYVEPVVTLDLDLVIAAPDLARVMPLLAAEFTADRLEHRLNLAKPGSDLRVQVQTDPRYAPFVDRAARAIVLGVELPVARIEDVLQGKVWAAVDPQRRASKRQKDLADIARILESRPQLRATVPGEILARLI